MILCINTTNFNVAHLALKDGSGKIVKEREFESYQKLSEQLLLEIDKMIQGTGYRIQEVKGEEQQSLQGIEVNTGPGSFTSVRVGVSVANALGFAFKIPVNGGKMAIPEYNRAEKTKDRKHKTDI